MNLQVVPLHHHPQYIKACCDLINSEWPRSDTARLHSLNASCDALPTSLVLLNGTTVIGHAKLSKIPSLYDACFIESVVISKNERGKGYGSMLMLKSEQFCRDFLKLKTIYLSTKGQEGFYNKLGYKVCKPVSIYGGIVKNTTENKDKSNNIVKLCESMSIKNESSAKNVPGAPLPPAPPLPTQNDFIKNCVIKTFMKKNLS